MKRILFLMLIGCWVNAYAIAPQINVHTLKIEKFLDVAELKNIQEMEIEVENPWDKEVQIILKTMHPQYNKSKQEDISLERYILSPEKVHTLAAKEKKKIKIGLKLPEDFKGTRYIFYSFDLVKADPKKSALQIELLSFGQLTVSVKGTLNRSVEIKKTIEKDKTMAIVKINMLNNGNTYIRRIEGYCLIQDKDKKMVGKFQFESPDKAYLFQTNDRVYTTVINKKLKGKYKMSIVFSNTDGNFNKVMQEEVEF